MLVADLCHLQDVQVFVPNRCQQVPWEVLVHCQDLPLVEDVLKVCSSEDEASHVVLEEVPVVSV